MILEKEQIWDFLGLPTRVPLAGHCKQDGEAKKRHVLAKAGREMATDAAS